MRRWLRADSGRDETMVLRNPVGREPDGAPAGSAAEWDLEPLLRPRSVAILGCSQDLSRLGGRPLKFLLERNYPGRVYPVNPKYSEIAGVRCYPTIKDVPEPVDTALVLVPAASVEGVLEECAAAGARSAIVFSSGFAEMGEEGRKAQKRIANLALNAGMPVLGPNCLGVINLFDNIPLSFSSILDIGALRSGGIAFVSQSGALATFVLGVAQEAKIGFSYWVTTGNEASLEASAVVRYLLRDERVSGVLLYMEEARDPRGLMEAGDLARALGKPLICLKVGRSRSGKRAASSHTGAMAGSDEAYAAAFRRAGIIRAEHVEELLDLGVAFTDGWAPRGKRVAILTMSGGGGILLADRCEELGLEVPELATQTQLQLKKVVPAFGAVGNPVDVTAELVASPGLLKKSLDVVLADPGIDSAVIFLGIQKKTAASLSRDIADAVSQARDTGSKPILVAWMAPPPEAVEKLREGKVPLFFDGVRAVNALAKMAEASAGHHRAPAGATTGLTPAGLAPSFAVAREATRGDLRRELESVLRGFRLGKAAGRIKESKLALSESQSKAFLRAAGLPVPRGGVAASADEAVALANALGYPVVAKVDSPDILHKSDARAVKVGLKTPLEVRNAFEEVVANSKGYLPDADIRGVLIEDMVSGGLEAIVGVRWDERFGPMVMLGLGGIFVEVLKDVSLRLAPVDEEEALSMIRELKAAKMFSGFRGSPPRDVKALSRVVADVSRLAHELGGSLLELDINPLFVLEEGKGVKVGDALLVLDGGVLSDAG